MASRMIKEERAARNERLRRAAEKLRLTSFTHVFADEARKHLTHEITVLGESLDMDLRDRISNIHSNANALETQSKQLKSRTQAMNKTSRQWSALAENGRGRLKEIGDVQNWAEMIERDLLVLEETLRIVNDEDVDAY
ncbi:hypothetical protein AOL_s00081g140 [Orbilia oligospora ATCC 24927]|uniref:Biogenesis of lysosome-related organelles complex 1 subunit 1 n=1 Tax=Arthrobotrys oligospora (strain ATCC 24927 / CBS 115.81 / DSM 1491) TaxID=756982 RepID=G1XFJ8_ARTOA|nr:hypothetical protein AOL_s00081g140 [Orbilia oligospora ATCC 24927]EGX48084.1 hypothetical protein AOL_s00081g140 [Orbilia oligospora ATCC 24927]